MVMVCGWGGGGGLDIVNNKNNNDSSFIQRTHPLFA